MKSEIKFFIQIIFLLKLIKADLISNLTLIVGNNTQYFRGYDNIDSDYDNRTRKVFHATTLNLFIIKV